MPGSKSKFIFPIEVSDVTEGSQIDKLNPNCMYFGYCEIGKTDSTSLAIWKIKKMTLVNGIYKTYWADGNDKYDNKFDDRATLDYS